MKLNWKLKSFIWKNNIKGLILFFTFFFLNPPVIFKWNRSCENFVWPLRKIKITHKPNITATFLSKNFFFIHYYFNINSQHRLTRHKKIRHILKSPGSGCSINPNLTFFSIRSLRKNNWIRKNKARKSCQWANTVKRVSCILL